MSSKSEAIEGRHAGPIVVRKRVHGAHEGHHGGACPAVVAVPICGGNQDYLAWIAEQTA